MAERACAVTGSPVPIYSPRCAGCARGFPRQCDLRATFGGATPSGCSHPLTTWASGHPSLSARLPPTPPEAYATTWIAVAILYSARQLSVNASVRGEAMGYENRPEARAELERGARQALEHPEAIEPVDALDRMLATLHLWHYPTFFNHVAWSVFEPLRSE